MNNNTYFNNMRYALYPFVRYFSYWLLVTLMFLLFYNTIDSNSCVILCDSAGSSVDQFFVDDTNQCNCSSKDSNKLYSDATYSYTNVYCSYIADRYKNIGKRKFYWFVTQKGKNNYPDYAEFKKSWDPNIKVISELKKQFKSEMAETSRKLSLAKRSLSWFVRGSKPGGGRGL